MTTFAEAHLAIESRMHTLWTDQSVTIRYENEPRKLPSGDWIRLVVRNFRPSEQGYSANNILYRRPGMIVAQCFVQAKTGTTAARTIAEAVIDIFEGQKFDGVTCAEGEVEELGDDGEGFWQVNAKIYFDFDFERSY